MAYARFTTEEMAERYRGLGFPSACRSDVYVYADVSGGITCCGCKLCGGMSYNLDTADEMAKHLRDHMDAGHAVPPGTIHAIVEDAEFIEAADEEELDEYS